MGRVTERRRVVRVRAGMVSERADTLTGEEPMEIRVNGRPFAITMRTPGDDFALAVGFLVSEGVVARAEEVSRVVYCAGAAPRTPGGGGAANAAADGAPLGTAEAGAGPEPAPDRYNTVDVLLADGVAPPADWQHRNVYVSSSCGMCGRTSLDAVRTAARWPLASAPRLTPELLTALPDRLRAGQKVFARTGGLHAAGLFAGDGTLLDLREDVGRHNAVDKVVGRALREGALPLDGTVLMVSGRASFELVQKAVMAGIPVLAAVSAPSSLAVDLAEESGLTLVGFLRGDSLNVYAGAQRLELPASSSSGPGA